MFRRIVIGSLVSAAFAGTGCGYFAPFDAPLPSNAGAAGRGGVNKGASASGAVAGRASNSGGMVSSSQAKGASGNGGASKASGGIAGSMTTSSLMGGGTGSSLLGGASQGGAETDGIAGTGNAETGGVSANSGAPGIGGMTATGGVSPTDEGSTGGTSTAGGTAATGGTSTITATGGATVVEPPSCRALTTKCQNESCCTTIKVPGGTFKMGRSTVEGASDYFPDGEAIEVPEHNTKVDDYLLDKYEVTVGRFREFVKDYDRWRAAENPKDNAGMHPRAIYTGWGRSWYTAATDLPADATALAASVNAEYESKSSTYIDGNDDAYPINWVDWFTAFAFCIWDAGRLPTEAEWEYAAAGGSENRMFPWGTEIPDASRANFSGSDRSPFVVVGSKGVKGAGRWGHVDLAGSMSEWVFDWYLADFYGPAESPAECDNCASAIESGKTYGRVCRGGGWTIYAYADFLRTTRRSWGAPQEGHDYSSGIRCARNP